MEYWPNNNPLLVKNIVDGKFLSEKGKNSCNSSQSNMALGGITLIQKLCGGAFEVSTFISL